jgi:hypothetical protein
VCGARITPAMQEQSPQAASTGRDIGLNHCVAPVAAPIICCIERASMPSNTQDEARRTPAAQGVWAHMLHGEAGWVAAREPRRRGSFRADALGLATEELVHEAPESLRREGSRRRGLASVVRPHQTSDKAEYQGVAPPSQLTCQPPKPTA